MSDKRPFIGCFLRPKHVVSQGISTDMPQINPLEATMGVTALQRGQFFTFETPAISTTVELVGNRILSVPFSPEEREILDRASGLDSSVHSDSIRSRPDIPRFALLEDRENALQHIRRVHQSALLLSNGFIAPDTFRQLAETLEPFIPTQEQFAHYFVRENNQSQETMDEIKGSVAFLYNYIESSAREGFWLPDALRIGWQFLLYRSEVPYVPEWLERHKGQLVKELLDEGFARTVLGEI